MMSTNDRKMFAPMRYREAAVSPEAKVFSILAGYEAGAIAANLAEALVRGGLAVGTRALVTKRISEMLDSMEQAGRVERIPDGRYRAVRSHVEGTRK
jgi:hypothetical protein